MPGPVVLRLEGIGAERTLEDACLRLRSVSQTSRYDGQEAKKFVKMSNQRSQDQRRFTYVSRLVRGCLRSASASTPVFLASKT
jgi:hypothetical protein